MASSWVYFSFPLFVSLPENTIEGEYSIFPSVTITHQYCVACLHYGLREIWPFRFVLTVERFTLELMPRVREIFSQSDFDLESQWLHFAAGHGIGHVVDYFEDVDPEPLRRVS